ncbi:MAG: ASKHA domain-containing protein [Candidatus Margulisiibacteriota bacterium]
MATLGLAVDIGTSNLASYIVDLDKPKDRFYLSIKNSQSKHGADVITRLTFASDKKNARILQQLLVNDLNNLIYALCKKISINRKRLGRIVVSGNPIMLHFLLGLNVDGFKTYPYRSEIKGIVEISAEKIGIASSKQAKLIVLPVISPYIGSDVTAGILYCGMNKTSSKKILIDLGTNAEMVIGNKDNMFATSAAAGPAFKGKDIVLGSHMISAVAKMLRGGEIDKNGKTMDAVIARSLATKQSPPSMGLLRPDRIGSRNDCHERVSQQDIRSFQLAKGAINAAIEILLQKSGYSVSDINKILLAGLFGEKIDIQDAIDTGLIPKVQKTKVRSIGNSSLEGTKMVLLKPELLAEAENIAKSVVPVELSMEKDYQERFVKNMLF